MAQIQSYTQAVRQQVEPPIKQLLSSVFDNFSEQLKLPDSPARKLLDNMVAIVSNAQLSEKLANEAQILLHRLTEINRKDEVMSKLKEISKSSSHGVGKEGEEEEEEETDTMQMLHNTSLELDNIQHQKQALQASYRANLQGLEDAKIEMLIGKLKQFGLDEESINDIIKLCRELTQQQAETPSLSQREGFVNQLSDTLKTVTQKATGGNPQAVTPDMLQAAMAKPSYSPSFINEVANAIQSNENAFTALKNQYEQSYNKSMQALDDRIQAIQGQRDSLSQRYSQSPMSTKPSPTSTTQQQTEKAEQEKQQEQQQQSSTTPTMGPKPG